LTAPPSCGLTLLTTPAAVFVVCCTVVPTFEPVFVTIVPRVFVA
jgi:hypothetical protein